MKPLRLFCVLIALLVAASPGLISAQKRSSSAAKKKAPAKRSPAPPGKRSAASAKHSSKKSTAKSSARSRRPVHRTTAPASQRSPEPERIREIQQALLDKGYPVEVSGAWDSRSVEALKKFQAEQNIKTLSGSGKIDALTLIALGLGPTHDHVAASPQPDGEVQSQ